VATAATRQTEAGRTRRVLRFAAAGAAGAVIAFLAVTLLRPAPSPEERLAELQAYLADLKPLAEETGFLVINGLKAGVNDIGQGRFPDSILRQQPRGWRADLERLRTKFLGLEPPPGLEDANAAFVESLDGYIVVTRRLEEAAHAPPYRRRMLVRRAADLGEDMDRVWNRGAYQIQRELAALGEDMVIWLPDPTLNPDADDYVDGDPDEKRPNDFLRETRPSATASG
jgi:hypothetical protein